MEYKDGFIADECTTWRNFRQGSQSALAIIFKENYDSLYYYGKKLYHDEDLVRDCIQNLFLKLWNKRESLGEIKYVKPYLMKALRRHIGDEVVALYKKKNIRDQFLYNPDITFSHEDFLIATQVSEEQSQALVKALNRLSIRQREAIYLRFTKELDYEKIADIMNLNVQSVRNLIYQGLKRMKELMLHTEASVLINLLDN